MKINKEEKEKGREGEREREKKRETIESAPQKFNNSLMSAEKFLNQP